MKPAEQPGRENSDLDGLFAPGGGSGFGPPLHPSLRQAGTASVFGEIKNKVHNRIILE